MTIEILAVIIIALIAIALIKWFEKLKTPASRMPAAQVSATKVSHPTSDAERPALPTRRDEMKNLLETLSRDVVRYPKTFPPKYPVTSLSFFGGRPIGPQNFQWPHDKTSGQPRFFMAQIDMSEMPKNDFTKMLPSSGVLYFFGNGAYETADNNVVYHSNPTDDWAEIDQPANMPKTFSASHEWNDYAGGPVSTFPKWIVTPTAAKAVPSYEELFFVPTPFAHDDASASLFAEVSQDLSHRSMDQSFGPMVVWPVGVCQGFKRGGSKMHQALPPIWLGVQIVSKKAWSKHGDDQPEHQDFLALRKRIVEQAARHNAFDVLSDADLADFRSFLDLATMKKALWGHIVDYTIESCMTHNADTASLISQAQADHIKHRKNDRGHQSGGFPGSVQGNYIENDLDHALLMEFNSDRGQHWAFDALIQYWITKDDLENERWDKVFVTVDGS